MVSLRAIELSTEFRWNDKKMKGVPPLEFVTAH